ncbi:MAG: prolipoprotein diacylglyceryl transferase [bacterium]
MYPILFSIGRLEIRAYGFMLALSFLIGIFWASKRAKQRGLNPNQVVDLSLLILLSSIIGSRILYVFTHLEEFRDHWTDTFNPFQSSGQIGIAGLTLLGGVLLAIIVIVVYCRWKKISLLKLFDVIAPVFGLGVFLTRIGCFLNGCCYGRPCDLPWAMKFPLKSAAGYHFFDTAIHPTQLYSSLYGLIIMIVIVLVDKKKHVDGFITGLAFIMYGIFRFLVDFVRYYEDTDMVSLGFYDITINQLISIGMVLFGIILLIILQRKNHRSSGKT